MQRIARKGVKREREGGRERRQRETSEIEIVRRRTARKKRLRKRIVRRRTARKKRLRKRIVRRRIVREILVG